MSVVVDASAIAAVVFEEPECDAVLERLKGHDLFAPPMIELELPNIYLKKLRRNPGNALSLQLSLEDFFAMPMQIEAVDLRDTLSRAARLGLSFYDACYAQLALDLAMPLITLDQRLAAAMARS